MKDLIKKVIRECCTHWICEDESEVDRVSVELECSFIEIINNNSNKKLRLSKNEENDICCEFMAKFGGLHSDKVNGSVTASEIMTWTLKKINDDRTK
ncbi:MAG: hypothetical protein GY928_14860 [Colwellia sp.]|nr:hypothetical protein [Colwellia sp.]